MLAASSPRPARRKENEMSLSKLTIAAFTVLAITTSVSHGDTGITGEGDCEADNTKFYRYKYMAACPC
jgi:hypothetical protein